LSVAVDGNSVHPLGTVGDGRGACTGQPTRFARRLPVSPDHVIPPTRSRVKQRRNGTDVASRIGAERAAEPMPLDCERIVDSGVRRLITMEE
jgi:hypothetical protein